MKEHAKQIISEVSDGKEPVIMTVVHLSEIVNILKHGMPLEQLTKLVRGLFMLDNVRILGVTSEAYFAANELGEDLKLEANDALTLDVMRMNNIKEIYSLDEDFEQMDEIVRLPKLTQSIRRDR
jgi:predicted nucleic acid-binding protein